MIPPPPAARPKSIPQVAWVLGALVLVAIMGIASYFFVLRPQAKRETPPPVAQVTPPQNTPATTPATQPGAPTEATTPPVATPETTPAKPEEAPQRNHARQPSRRQGN